MTREQMRPDWIDTYGGLVMIDSACPISDYGPGGGVGRAPVVIDLPPGPCRVEVARVGSPEGSAVAVVHRFSYR